MKFIKYRDLSIVKLPKGKSIVISCDSCGSIGSKENDKLNVPAYITGRYTARVVLFEVLAYGAEVVAITNCVSNEMNDTASEILQGLKDELIDANINENIINGSTEENFETSMTAVGMTCIGYLEGISKVKPINKGDKILFVGEAKVGIEVKLGYDSEIINYEDLKYFHSINGVKEIVPVGSKGARYEAELLAKYNNLSIKYNYNSNVDIDKSSGPATSAIVVVSCESLNMALRNTKTKVIGQFE